LHFGLRTGGCARRSDDQHERFGVFKNICALENNVSKNVLGIKIQYVKIRGFLAKIDIFIAVFNSVAGPNFEFVN